MTMMVLMVVMVMMIMMMIMMARWRRQQAVEKEVWSDCPACPSADRWFLVIARYEGDHLAWSKASFVSTGEEIELTVDKPEINGI